MINKVGESVSFLTVFVGLNGSKEELGIKAHNCWHFTKLDIYIYLCYLIFHNYQKKLYCHICHISLILSSNINVKRLVFFKTLSSFQLHISFDGMIISKMLVNEVIELIQCALCIVYLHMIKM